MYNFQQFDVFFLESFGHEHIEFISTFIEILSSLIKVT